MNQMSDERALELLRAAMPAVGVDRPLDDLWPRVRRRIDRGPMPPSALDWILVATVALLCLLQPSLAGLVLLHF
jgi:hypothetical protein